MNVIETVKMCRDAVIIAACMSVFYVALVGVFAK